MYFISYVCVEREKDRGRGREKKQGRRVGEEGGGEKDERRDNL